MLYQWNHTVCNFWGLNFFSLSIVALTSTQLCNSISQSYLTLCNPMDYSMSGFPVLHHRRSLLKLKSIEVVMPSNHLILCHPLLLLPSIFPSSRVFPNESFIFGVAAGQGNWVPGTPLAKGSRRAEGGHWQRRP